MSIEHIITNKDEIIAKARKYLQTNSLIDLTGFITNEMKYADAPSSFVRDVAYKMERIGDYEVIQLDNWERFYVKRLPNKLLRDREPVLFQTLIVGISVIISSIATIIIQQHKDQEQSLKYYQLQEHLIHQSDSLRILQTEYEELKDSERKK